MQRAARQLMLASASIGILAAAIFVAFPNIDLRVSSYFFNGDGQFVGAHQTEIRRLRGALLWFSYAALAVCIAGFLVTRFRRSVWLSLRPAQWLFIALCLTVGPGLLTNVILKDHWGRARPKQVVGFGGTKTFSPPLIPADQCEKNCSFVSGEASSIFMIFYAGALVVPQGSALLIAAGTLGGIVAGAIRISQGAHFLSDVVFAGIFMALTAALMHELMFGSAMSPSRKWLLCGALCALAVGTACTRPEVRRSNVQTLQVGMSRDQVMAVMGSPRAIEAYGTVEFWLYRVDTRETEEDTILPIGFVDGRVTGWGRLYYEDATTGRIRPDGSVPK